MDWKAIVKSVAPTQNSPVAGTAIKFLADHFLKDADAQEQDIAELILNASPEKLLELLS